MTTPKKAKKPKSVFRMPSVQTMVTRKSSITNAFVNSIIPVIKPTEEEIAQALVILEMTPTDVRCAYCGDPYSEWDHLRAIVVNHRPTGYISEIANLVPSCGKCNQSKGNKPWREWMLSTTAPRSPTARGLPDVAERMKRLEAFEAWREPIKLAFEIIAGAEAWSAYWMMWNAINADMQKCHAAAKELLDLARRSLVKP